MAKLVIKLKLLDEEDEEDKTKHYRHTCKVCNKKFSCGKAYGGHKRIHTMKRKEKKPIEETNVQFCDDMPRYYKCFFCPKTFRAKKSFEEHLMTHGFSACVIDSLLQPALQIHDPNSSSSTQQSNDASEAEADNGMNSGTSQKQQIFSDLAKVLPRTWGMSGRRGRDAKAELICVPSSIDMHQEADDLMVQSRGKLESRILPLKKRKMYSPPLQEQQHFTITERDCDHGKEKTAVLENSAEASYHDLEGDNVNAHHKREAKGNFVERCARGPWRHRCPNCNKSYKKGQALWAHRRFCERTITTPLIDHQVVASDLKRAFPFDLNELPPPDREDGMDGQ